QDNDGDLDKTVQWFFTEYEDLWTQWVPEEIANEVKKSTGTEDGKFGFSLSKFPENINIEFGIYIEKLVSWLTKHFQGFFDGLAAIINWIVSGIRGILV